MRTFRIDAEEAGQQPPGREAADGAPRGSAGEGGGWVIRLLAYGGITVAVTVFLLRPAGRVTSDAQAGNPSASRSGLNLGSGVIGLALKTGSILSSPEDQKTKPPTPASSTPSPTTKPLATAPARTESVAGAIPVKSKPAAPQPNRPGRGDMTWSGLRGALTQSQPQGTKVKPAVISGDKNPFAREPKKAAPGDAGAPAAQRPDVVASAPAAPQAGPAPQAAPAPVVQLGSRYQDPASGYSMQFPAGWTHKHVRGGGGWVLDATDGRGAVISIGFAPFPANVSAEQVSPERIASALRSRPGTVVHGGGFGNVAGRKCLWHKYTGPIPREDGNARMTAVHYLMPLGDGRALELRAATAPEKFDDLAPKMKQSVGSFRLVTPQKPVRVASAQKKTA